MYMYYCYCIILRAIRAHLIKMEEKEKTMRQPNQQMILTTPPLVTVATTPVTIATPPVTIATPPVTVVTEKESALLLGKLTVFENRRKRKVKK